MSRTFDQRDKLRWSRKEKRRKDTQAAQEEARKKRLAENFYGAVIDIGDQEASAQSIALLSGGMISVAEAANSLSKAIKTFPRYQEISAAAAEVRARYEAELERRRIAEQKSLEEYAMRRFPNIIVPRNFAQTYKVDYDDEPAKKITSSGPDPMLENTRRFRP